MALRAASPGDGTAAVLEGLSGARDEGRIFPTCHDCRLHSSYYLLLGGTALGPEGPEPLALLSPIGP